ncbi:sensor histidine kinase [Paenibacillus alkalitolerans]|uniref:sensor histidine kinase n=1 Tax=Paenibacillus alkalitolerans TaxID=2799335 RepID=UPI0018F3F284|nr:sensor histidine kinase [Paenibacillus alkalitolerans]
MPFVFTALLTAAIILFIADPRRKSARWLSFTSLCGALGALAALIDNRIYPYVELHYAELGVTAALYRLQAWSSLASYYGLPYGFLMFAIHYRGVRLPREWAQVVPALLFVPIGLCLALTPGYTESYPIAFPVVASWAVPYFAAGIGLVLSKREVNRVLRRGHIVTCLAVLPPIAFFMVLNYILQSLGMIGAWRHNTWVVAAGFAVFLYSLFRYGFMGVQLLVQTRRLDSTLRAVTSGTAILNHAIKNDVGKMRLFGAKIQAYAEQTGQKELAEDIKVVLGSSEHIQEMISRVHDKTQEMPLRIEPCSLTRLCEDVLEAETAGAAEIAVTKEWSGELLVDCDKAQTAEVLTNIVRNAVEAMPEGGRLYVKIYETKRTVSVEIRDTGVGIDRKQISQVLEPFYTTKAGRALNFGLGLAYCYSVMRKHGGTLDLHSEVGRGTAVSLNFPKGKRAKMKAALDRTAGRVLRDGAEVGTGTN